MRFLTRRALFYLVTAWVAITINFAIPRLMPGNPVEALLSRVQGQVSAAQTASLNALFGLKTSDSLIVQYWHYLGDVVHGDFGLSFTYFPSPVSEVLSSRLPWTIALVGIATVISFVLGTAIGAGVGWRRGSLADSVLPVTTFFASVPYFWLGLLAVAVFAIAYPVLPAAGGYDPGLVPGFDGEFIASALRHGVLPALTIVVSSIAAWILGMRNMMVTVTTEEYVTVAHAKGLGEGRVMLAYAARNAVLPSVSNLALSLGFIVGGTLATEMVFSYPGIGYALFQAIGAKDYPLMQAIFLVITLSVLVANLLADVAYVVLDPRTRREG